MSSVVRLRRFRRRLDIAADLDTSLYIASCL